LVGLVDGYLSTGSSVTADWVERAARLLMLALTTTQDFREIQEIFLRC
jgi:hypothetical protein